MQLFIYNIIVASEQSKNVRTEWILLHPIIHTEYEEEEQKDREENTTFHTSRTLESSSYSFLTLAPETTLNSRMLSIINKIKMKKTSRFLSKPTHDKTSFTEQHVRDGLRSRVAKMPHNFMIILHLNKYYVIVSV